jgi:amino acid adenylation domain-containing protein
MTEAATLTAEKTPQNRRRELEAVLKKRAEKARRFPLSFSQQRLWVLDQLEPGNPVYNIPLAVGLSGPLDIDALQHTVNELVARHDSLRTKIVLTEDQPMQVVQPARAQELTVVDLEHVEPADREAEAVARAKAEARKPFRLDEGPLYRASLLRFSPTEHVLVVVLHHIISDDWSVAVLFREVAELYHAFKSGRPSPLEPLPIQYADYAVWQRQQLQGETLRQLLDYWRTRLQDVPDLDLPADQPHSLAMPQAGETETRRLPPALAKRLRELARREGATLYMVLLAAFQTLLHRYSGQEDFSVGSPIAGRLGKGTEGLVGFFVNTLVLRADLTGAPTFRGLLARVRQTSLDAFQHQELPFERLVEALNPDRGSGRQPLFQVMLTLQNAPWPVVNLDQLSLTPLPINTGTAKFELSFTCREDREGLSVTAEYRSCLFQPATVKRMLRHFENLLESVVSDPDRQVAELSLLDEAERETLLIARNATQRDYPAGLLLHQLFEAQARRTPDAVAVKYEQQQLTYRELDERANRLARRLRALDVGPDALVGIFLERSLELVVGLLGVLKAGGAYVPVDPSYPADRVEFMLGDGPVPLVLTQRHLTPSLRGYAGRVLALDGEADLDGDGSAVDCPAAPDHAAYVLYTSGSTGRPKGVVITHRAICNHMHWMAEEYPLEPGDALLQKTPISFDPSVWEFYAPLMAGARLVMAQPYGHMDPRYLTRVIQEQQITILRVVPTLLQMLVAEPSFADCTSLRRVLVGGEALSMELVQRTAAAIRAELCNMYGPTEASIVATSFRWDGRTTGTTVPIGRPMANAEAYVLDARGQLVPSGVPGELYLGGTGLARGYLNRPELTDERFVPHPFCSEPGARLYRTGDRVRWLPDGNLEFLGRLDDQVKIRGNRIELGEIQSVLSTHPDVRKAVVTAFDNGAGGKELAAYWVAREAAPPVDQLREFLRKSLPEYMIPSVFVALDSIPLMPNGKVDFKALPRPSHQRDEQAPYVPPRTADEQLLADIWREVLHVDKVSVHDNFFALGGHSLLATQVVSRITRGLNVDLPLREMFQTPTIAALAERLTEIRSRGAASCREPISAAPRDEPLPASFAQEALWVLDRLDPGSAVYNVPLAVRVTGPLDTDALTRTLHEVVARHESLRTKMAVQDGRLIQVIEAVGAQPLTIVDLQDLAPAQREAQVASRAAAEARRPFDLEQGPLFRASLLRLSPTEHVLVLAMHHIISDDWSMGVLFSDLVALYQAFAAGRPSPLNPLSIQYADYAVCQRQRLQGEHLQHLLDYWCPHLQGVAPLDLPTDRPRSRQATSAGATIETHLPAALTAQLKDLGRREGATLYMTLLAAFQVLLHRYSGQEDFAVGSPIANRLRPEIESLIGYFINVVVLRANLAGDPTFRTLLGHVRQTALEAFEHQELPFEKLVEALNPERDAGRHPLFQVLFTLQNAPRPEVNLADLAFSVLPLDTDTSKFELSFTAWEDSEGLALSVEYRSDLFKSDTIERMIQHFRVLLERLVADADQPVSQLPLMTEVERRQLLLDWNRTEAEFPQGVCLHNLFEAQAARTPEAVAAVCRDESLSYAELNARANQWANFLQERGVGPEVFVGVCLERSLDMAAAVLAVLKAGGAYVPLDPDYPRERLDFVVADSEPSLLLTTSDLAGRISSGRVPLVFMDREQPDVSRRSTANPACQAGPDNAVYVIYTSGSTGTPKGAVNLHRGLCNNLTWETRFLGLDASDRVLFKTPLSFDVAVVEYFRALVCGGRVVIAEPGAHRDPRRLADLIAREGVTTVEFVPSMLRAMLDEPQFRECRSLRRVCCGAEALPPGLAASFFREWKIPLFNLYGPTETSVGVAGWKCEPEDDVDVVPIGRPVSNVRLYILDKHCRPVPMGVPGELHVGGVAVGRGYLNRPELNASRFITDPFTGAAGERLYKTGDRCRYLPDGNIEYLGRLDAQVKIRGFRIELGEIEAVLKQHSEVREAVVVAREIVPGDHRLAAYVMPDPGGKLSCEHIEAHLRERLPEFMVPSFLTMLDQFPLLPNGKVDRRALPAPDWNAVQRDAPYVAPRTEDEKQLAQIWQEVLHVARVGVHDNFFALGGHSLLATQMVSRIARDLRVELPLRDVFLTPTIADLAGRIVSLRMSGPVADLPPIQPVPRDAPLPASYGQEALWVIDRLQEGPSPYVTFPGARIQGPLDVAAFERALNEVLRRHESLRTTFAAREGRPVQVIAPHTPQRLTVVDLSGLPENARSEEVRRCAAALSRHRIDLAVGPLVRVELLRLDAEQHLVLVGLHHIIYDGWSMAVLDYELLAVYRAFAAGLPSPLPELPIQYADYAVWQRERLQGEVLERLRQYWLKQLEDLPTLELPTDRPRPPVRTSEGGVCRRRLPNPLSQAVRRFSQAEGATTFMTLLAAFQILLHRYSGQEDFPIGTPAAGRLRPETESLIGYFVNALVLRANLSGDPAFRELLGRVRETAVAAFEHQELPFERLVQDLNPARDPSRHPVFQVMLILQNTPEAFQDARLDSELKLSEFQAGQRQAASDFDLAMMIGETAEGLDVSLGYRTDLFDEPTIERMLQHFETLLELATTDPGRRLSELPLLAADERQRMLVEWNRTEVEFPQETCLPDMFEAQAARTPEAIAAVCELRELTYRELNARANRLAHWLRKQGVGPDHLVAIHLERSLDVLVGILGILKADGAFLPLDAELPSERLAFMLEDARVEVVLTQQSLAGRLPVPAAAGEKAGPRIVCLDAQWEMIAGEAAANPPRRATSRHLAYAIYTSGSTGQPKGVLIEHRSVVNVVTSFIRSYAVGPADRVLQSASISFDVSVNEIFPALCTGATVVLPNKHERLDLDGLGEFVRRNGVTIMAAAPAALARLNKLPNPLPGVRLVLSGGEALSFGEVDRLRELATVVNGYGPTEATICATSFPLVSQAADAQATVPIGKPLANYQVYVVDRYSDCAAVGCAGELCIGGVGLARGYLNDEELTARKFVANPFCPGQRMYRTGDCVRWLPDGNLEFLGRMDRQVKVRGYRIELGELEALLTAHPAVEKAAVVDWQAGAGDRRLVAYVILTPSGETAAADRDRNTSLPDLKGYLAGKVPQYMVPAAFVRLDALPLTANGKVDRRRLPDPGLAASESRAEYVAPRSALEEQLAAVWCEVLGLERVGIRDDFFELGGHSLLAIQAMSRLNGELNVNVPLRDLFESPTIEALAQRMQAARPLEACDGVPPIRPAPRDGVIPMAYNQEPFWVASQLAQGPAPYAFHPATRLRGPLDVRALEQALNEMLRRHEALRTTFAETDNGLVQVIAPYRPRTLRAIDLSELPAERREEELWRRIDAEAQCPLDLANGPLMRVELLKLAADEHVVLAGMHHIVYDGWSMAVFFRELITAYLAFAAQLPSPLPEPAIQYADFAAWQRERLQGERYDALRRFWLEQLAELPALNLPTDRPRPAVRTTRSAVCTRQLPRSLAQAVQRLGNQEGATTFMILLAAWQTLLSRYSGQDDFGVSTPVAGRLRPETETVVGCFVNDLVLRANQAGNPSFRELLGRVRETVLRAFDHQEMPFSRLLRELHPLRDPSRRTLVQTELILQNTPRGPGNWPGLEVTDLAAEADIEGADFDLCLEASERDEGLSLRLCYHADLFDEARAVRMLEHLQEVLEAATADPSRRVSALPLSDVARASPQEQPRGNWRDDAGREVEARCHVAPRTQIEEQVAAIWARTLQLEHVGVEDDFFILGGDSLLAVRMMLQLGTAFDLDLPPATVFSASTVAAVAERIEAAQRQRRGSVAADVPATVSKVSVWRPPATEGLRSLVALRPGGSAAPLFCVHGLGGHVTSFLPLALGLDQLRPVYGLQALGLGAGQQPHDRIEVMAGFYLNEIRQVQPGGPYALAGWSMGGLIALEAARQLAASGEQVALLALFDTSLPHPDDAERKMDDSPAMPWIARQLNLPLADLAGLTLDRQWQRIAERADLVEGDVAVGIRRLAAVCRAHLAALAAYQARPYQGCAVLFQAVREERRSDRRWQSIVPGLRVERVPGDHFTMLQPPHVSELTERLGRYLAEGVTVDATARTP